MDSLAFETYSSYSDSSAPRTPSPSEYYFSKGSFLHELYEPEVSPPEYQQHSDWQPHHRPSEFSSSIFRRATFPYVKQDREDIHQHYPPYIHHHQQQHYHQHYSSSPYHDFEELNIKLEDTNPLIVAQSNCYRSPIMPSYPPSSHNGLPVQHTDDAASKETQYLRRRCFNCHTTEPPSWRRSTLNPGKIVCNKCGLYERTHLRPRPLRFDELRSGSKQRKSSKASTSPKQSKIAVKKEPGIDRCSSVSSTSSYYSSPALSEVILVPQVPQYFSHSQNGAPPEGVLWVESTEMNNSSSPTGSS